MFQCYFPDLVTFGGFSCLGATRRARKDKISISKFSGLTGFAFEKKKRIKKLLE